jgi:hypothetical protein
MAGVAAPVEGGSSYDKTAYFTALPWVKYVWLDVKFELQTPVLTSDIFIDFFGDAVPLNLRALAETLDV